MNQTHSSVIWGGGSGGVPNEAITLGHMQGRHMWGVKGHQKISPTYCRACKDICRDTGQLLSVGTALAVVTHQVPLLQQVMGWPWPRMGPESLPHPCTGWKSPPISYPISTSAQHGSQHNQTPTGTATAPVPKILKPGTRCPLLWVGKMSPCHSLRASWLPSH